MRDFIVALSAFLLSVAYAVRFSLDSFNVDMGDWVWWISREEMLLLVVIFTLSALENKEK